MACTESNWACEPPSMVGLQPHYADYSCRSDDRLCGQGGQLIDAQSGSASHGEKFRKVSRLHGRSWQDSYDFQEFGFSYNTVDPTEVAPADELFYKGQILPLQTDTRIHVVQALSSCCMREQLGDVTRHAGRPSTSVSRDDELKFNSCRIDGATNSNALGAMRSFSFRSQHSGYWESGGEKEMTDTSSSSRDSNGSSQDSYIPNANSMSHINFKVKPSLTPWKSFFGGLMRGSRRHPPSLPIVAFSEDLSKYRPVADLPLAESKVGLASLMPDKDVGQDARHGRAGFKSKFAINQPRFSGGLKGKCVLSDGVENGVFKRKSDLKSSVEDGKPKSKSGLQDKELQKSIPQYCKEGSSGTTKVKFPRFNKGRLKSKCTNKDASKGAKIAASRDADGQKQRRSAVKERWQGYARKLRPLYEVKKGLMGQFRMDECAKNACEVESGIVRRPSLQRRLSHQSSFFKNHKFSMEHEENGGSPYIASNNNMQMAMSSCPPSTRSSPNHSGVLAVVVDSKPKLSGGNPNHTTKKLVSNESISMSTMHELHSAVQSAIAHCKESNKRYHLD